MPARILPEKEREERYRRIIEMYQNGATNKEIRQTLHVSGETIRYAAQKAGIYVKRRGAYRTKVETDKKKPRKAEGSKGMMPIRAEEIERARKIIKPGSYMNIRTDKALTIDQGCGNTASGYIRRAVVIDNRNERFCRVRIEKNGVEEYIKWTDIVIAMRKNRPYVG